MNVWTKRLFVLLSVGGGFTGAILMAMLFPQMQGQIAGYVLIMGMIATFGFGVFCGLKFIEDESRGLRLLRIFFGIQIPVFSSPIIAYKLGSGAALFLSWIGWRASIDGKVGSEMWVSVFQSQPWGIGLNVFALILFIWTGRILKRIEGGQSSALVVGDPGVSVAPDNPPASSL